MEPIVLSWSGGKDSALALDRLRRDPSLNVVALLTSVTAVYDRVSIHGVRRALLHAQARALDLPVHEIVLDPDCTNDAYDAAQAAALLRLKSLHPDLRRIAYGDLFLEDVRQYREARLPALGLAGAFPLWGLNTSELAREFVDRGFEARLVCVDTTQLDARFAGRAYDHALLDELPASVDPCGERGEFHTFVSSGPIFRAPIQCVSGDVVVRDERFAYCDVIPSFHVAT
jgi:uncharacterized protein (TIGR00290 family)